MGQLKSDSYIVYDVASYTPKVYYFPVMLKEKSCECFRGKISVCFPHFDNVGAS